MRQLSAGGAATLVVINSSNQGSGAPDDAERRSFAGALYGRRALEQLAAAIAPPAGAGLELDLTGVTRADTYTGVVMRTAIECHLRAGSGNRVAVWAPRQGAARAMVDTLLNPLPPRCDRSQDPPRESASPHVHVPSLLLEDARDVDMITQLVLRGLAARRALRVQDARALQRSVAALGDNALVHGVGGPCPPVAALALEPMGHELQLVVTSLGAETDPHGLRAAVARTRERLGGLESIGAQADRKGLDLSLRLISGTARAHRRHGRWRYQDGPLVPGWTAVVEIHL